MPDRNERWRELIRELTSELDHQFLKLKELEGGSRFGSPKLEFLDHHLGKLKDRDGGSRVGSPKLVTSPPILAPNFDTGGDESVVLAPGASGRSLRSAAQDRKPTTPAWVREPPIPTAPPGYSKEGSKAALRYLQDNKLEEDITSTFGLTGLLRSDMRYNIVRAQRTKHFVAQKPWYVINPDSNQLAGIWQVVSAIAMAYVALITPLQVCLLDISLDWLFVVSMCMDMVFFIDMFLQFFTTYARTTPTGLVWEVSLRKIAWQYGRTWFLFDFLTLIPFDLVGLLTSTDALKELKIVKVIRTLRLVKLVRLLKSSSLLHRLEIPFSLPYQQFALLRFLSVLVLMCHWLACVWALTLDLVEQTFPQWIDDVEAVDAQFGINTRQSPWRIYVASFYFCSYTMTSVGYGDFGPKNILERIACTIMVMVSGLCWAYILGEVCAIVADMNADSQLFRKRMHQLNTMMRDQGLPHELRARLRSFFLQNRHQLQFTTQLQLLNHMSPHLQSEVCRVLNLNWIRKVPFFAQFIHLVERLKEKGMVTNAFEACVADISRNLDCAAYAQRDCFSSVQVLYILSKGLVALDNRFGEMGTVWGEDFVLADSSLVHVVNCVAMSYCEVVYLTREKFMAVVEARKTTCPELGRIVRRYCVRVAVFRGILREAQRRARARSNPRRRSVDTSITEAPTMSLPLPGHVSMSDSERPAP